MELPTPLAADSPPDLSVLDAFQGAIHRPRLSVSYHLALGLVAVTMVVLPVLYVALIGLAGYGLFYFVTHDYGKIWNSGFGIGSVVCAWSPLLTGSMVVLFLVKPLFARRGRRMQPYVLNPADEPLLDGFIQRVCAQVGAPAPRVIQLDCSLNASAGFRRGLGGLFRRDLVLTLGMPLVAGLNMGEFAGVVAHEFGHFRQGAGMRLGYIIGMVNGWFARVVFERDAWDAHLRAWSRAGPWWIRIVVGCARLGVGLSRWILRQLMTSGLAVSGFLMREREHDADRYAVELAGSEAVESFLCKLKLLSHVSASVYRHMRHMWHRTAQLPDNLPLYLQAHASRLSPEATEQVLAALSRQKTGPLDTHPATMERVRRAREANVAGIFALQDPARELFENFENFAHFVTLAHYQDDLKVPAKPGSLVPVEVLLALESQTGA